MSDTDWPITGEYVAIPITRHPDPDNVVRSLRAEVIGLRERLDGANTQRDNAYEAAALSARTAERLARETGEAMRGLDDLTRLNDRLQDEQVGHLARIDELEQELIEQGQVVSELRRTVAELRGTR